MEVCGAPADRDTGPRDSSIKSQPLDDLKIFLAVAKSRLRR